MSSSLVELDRTTIGTIQSSGSSFAISSTSCPLSRWQVEVEQHQVAGLRAIEGPLAPKALQGQVVVRNVVHVGHRSDLARRPQRQLGVDLVVFDEQDGEVVRRAQFRAPNVWGASLSAAAQSG